VEAVGGGLEDTSPAVADPPSLVATADEPAAVLADETEPEPSDGEPKVGDTEAGVVAIAMTEPEIATATVDTDVWAPARPSDSEAPGRGAARWSDGRDRLAACTHGAASANASAAADIERHKMPFTRAANGAMSTPLPKPIAPFNRAAGAIRQTAFDWYVYPLSPGLASRHPPVPLTATSSHQADELFAVFGDYNDTLRP
jgi:hypothetical protein